jgi:D-alanine-D-alanine ligase/UDP-N-acetylmuramate--alanine ligase
MKVGILFGGRSREREVSFAGGRTIYDNLDKSLFEPIPIFIDSLGNFIHLDWKYIYKGTIRDFYPSNRFYPPEEKNSQLYIESLQPLSHEKNNEIANSVGQKISLSDLKDLIDFAFLTLHGSFGEDGTIQGILEWLGIPYSGSGILPSAIGIDKIAQKQLLKQSGEFQTEYLILKIQDWKDEKRKNEILDKIRSGFQKKVVVKSPRHGSSIGVSIVDLENTELLANSIDASFFLKRIGLEKWAGFSGEKKNEFTSQIGDIKSGLGFPVQVRGKSIYSPGHLLDQLDAIRPNSSSSEEVIIEAKEGESQVLVEQFIEGREFSCIVLRNMDGKPVALPPTEIHKGQEVFDYRSKYLPGRSRKETPMNLPEVDLEKIRKSCENLFFKMKANVYARIDGFFLADKNVYLNDPNTTSGMMPSSFFFHQAAEIGLNPTELISYIIQVSIAERIQSGNYGVGLQKLKGNLEKRKNEIKTENQEKKKVAVILGGYSSERHISVESGRNIFEKLSSSTKFSPSPVFLTGNKQKFELYEIPINLLLKDNADDISDQIKEFQQHPISKKIREEASGITKSFSSRDILVPRKIQIDELKNEFDSVFIALHGRPGEDGQLQGILEEKNIPFNGSPSSSSATTINKYLSNEILQSEGILVPANTLIEKEAWFADPRKQLAKVREKLKFPFICKPADDGCSSAVKRISNKEEFAAFAEMTFRNDESWPESARGILKLDPKEEFPKKEFFLVEELISDNGAARFLEITGGLLTRYSDKGEIQYEIFDPSETLTMGDVLTLEEKFLAGEGQNITPARFWEDADGNKKISRHVREVLEKTGKILNVQGYARIDAFVRIQDPENVEVIIIEVNSLPGMTPATCIFHQSALKGYKPIDFIARILEFGDQRQKMRETK